MQRLEGKVAIVTGAAKGIGRATSVELARCGAKVVMAGIRESSMKEVRAEVAALTDDFLILQAFAPRRRGNGRDGEDGNSPALLGIAFQPGNPHPD